MRVNNFINPNKTGDWACPKFIFGTAFVCVLPIAFEMYQMPAQWSCGKLCSGLLEAVLGQQLVRVQNVVVVAISIGCTLGLCMWGYLH